MTECTPRDRQRPGRAPDAAHAEGKYELLRPATCLLIGAAFFLVSNGRWIVPVAAVLAPVFFLRYLRFTRITTGLPVLAVVMIIGTNVVLAGIVPTHLGLLAYLLKGVIALLWFLPYVADRVLRGPTDSLVGTLVFPASVTTVEYVNGLIYGTWGSVAYTQYENLALLQLASVTGIWGVTFLITWLASLADWAWARRGSWSAIQGRVAILATLFVLVHLVGGLRLAIPRAPSDTVIVGWFTPGPERDRRIEQTRAAGYQSFRQFASADRLQASKISRDYVSVLLGHSEELARRGAQVVSWPEGVATILAEDEQWLLGESQKIAQHHGLYLLLGYSLLPPNWPTSADENKTVLIDSSGKTVWHYLKTHPAPGATHKAGDRKLPWVDTSFGRLSGAICYDLDFPNLIRQAGLARVDLFLAPSWDWRAIDPLHTRMAVVRAIENGFSLVRPTGMGLSVAVDRWGRVVASADHFDNATDRLVTAQVPLSSTQTFYSRTGDWFAWLCAAFCLYAAARTVASVRDSRRQEHVLS